MIESTRGGAAAESARPMDPLPSGVIRSLAGVVSVRRREVVKVPTFRAGKFEREEVAGIGAGSGVVISADGLILTNAHVAAGSADIRVTFPNGREAAARVLEVDEASDLALLRADGPEFHPIEFAPGGPPPAGTEAYVIGNREDLGPEIAWARIGSHRRVRVGARPLEFWAEVEAPVGPGNSGGAVLDGQGRLLGIPSLMILYSENEVRAEPHASGLFIPAAHVRRALEKMTARPRAAWPWLGLLLEDSLLAASEGTAWREDEGVRVRMVFPGSPADAAGLRRGDRIVSIDGRRPRDNFEALDAVLDLAVGGSVFLELDRQGEILTSRATAAARPADPRPDPLDDFALHTGLRLESQGPIQDGRGALAFASMSSSARSGMPIMEADLFAERPVLDALLPGRDALAGASRRVPIASPADLSTLLDRCFVEEEFVALAHWSLGGRRTLDRAHVHRKVYPVVL
jgi:S1-C subfamily serine protease